MFVAIVGMLLGLAMSIWGIGHDDIKATWIGLVMIVAVCVSWWFWVMFIIRTMIEQTDRTQQSLGDIKTGIREVRHMVRDLDSNTQG